MHDYVTLIQTTVLPYLDTIGLLLIVAILFYHRVLDHKRELAREIRGHRSEMFQSFLQVWFTMQMHANEPFTPVGFNEKIAHAKGKILLYGHQDEREWMEQFVSAIEQKDIAVASAAVHTLVQKARRELGNMQPIALAAID